MRNIIILLFCVASIPIDIKAINYDLAEIHINLWTDKEEYIEGEPVFLHIQAINNSDHDLMFLPYQQNLINLVDENGTKYKQTTVSDISYGKNFFKNDTFRTLVYLHESYVREFEKNKFSYFNAGNYTINVSLNDPVEKVEAYSKAITFKVTKPDSSNQKIFRDLINAYSVKDEAKKRILFHNIIKEYPGSVYAPTAAYLLILTYSYTEDSKNKDFFELCDSIIRQFPTSGYCGIYLINIMRYFRRNYDYGGAKNYLEQLRNENLSSDLNHLINENFLKIVNTRPFEEW